MADPVAYAAASLEALIGVELDANPADVLTPLLVEASGWEPTLLALRATLDAWHRNPDSTDAQRAAIVQMFDGLAQSVRHARVLDEEYNHGQG